MNQALTQNEWEWEECKKKCSLFMESLCQRLGPFTMMDDLVELGAEDTPQYDPYQESQTTKLSSSWMKNQK